MAAAGFFQSGGGRRVAVELPRRRGMLRAFATQGNTSSRPASHKKGSSSMPQFHIQGDTDAFENAESFEIQGEMSRHGFVTAERTDEQTVLISEVHLKDLQAFDGPLFQVDIDEEEDSVILRQVQMFFWPWEDDEEFEDQDEVDGGDEV